MGQDGHLVAGWGRHGTVQGSQQQQKQQSEQPCLLFDYISQYDVLIVDVSHSSVPTRVSCFGERQVLPVTGKLSLFCWSSSPVWRCNLREAFCHGQKYIAVQICISS